LSRPSGGREDAEGVEFVLKLVRCIAAWPPQRLKRLAKKFPIEDFRRQTKRQRRLIRTVLHDQPNSVANPRDDDDKLWKRVSKLAAVEFLNSARSKFTLPGVDESILKSVRTGSRRTA
jgi:hypothetical protein